MALRHIGMGVDVNDMAQDGVTALLPLILGLPLFSVSILKEHGIYSVVRGKRMVGPVSQLKYLISYTTRFHILLSGHNSDTPPGKGQCSAVTASGQGVGRDSLRGVETAVLGRGWPLRATQLCGGAKVSPDGFGHS